MLSQELKNIIAQNCPGYFPKYNIGMESMGTLAQSCTNCSNYVRGKCIKDLYDTIKEQIRIN